MGFTEAGRKWALRMKEGGKALPKQWGKGGLLKRVGVIK